MEEQHAEVLIQDTWVRVVKERTVQSWEGPWLRFRKANGEIGLARPEHWREKNG